MIKSLCVNLGLVVVALGTSFWAMGSLRPMNPVDPVTSKPATDVLRPTTEVNLPTPQIQEVVTRTRAEQQDHHLLDLNRASAGELEALPGIGTVLAQRVIAFRTAAGGFRTVDDLREVKGIGTKKFDRLKTLVTVLPSGSQQATQREL